MFSTLRFLFCALILVVGAAQHAWAQPTIFVVRHAERADAGMAGTAMRGDDPELSPRGRDRAQSLALILRDAGIRSVYTTELKRTQQTGAPIAAAVGARTTTVPAGELSALVEKVRSEAGNVLIVGHSNTIPKILAALGVGESIEIGSDEYDNLFVVLPGTPARLVRLRLP